MGDSFNFDAVRELLETKVQQYNTPDFISQDPISIPHHFSQRQDIKIIGFVIALISWGRRDLILKSGTKLLQLMGNSPYSFIMDYESSFLTRKHFVHRTFNNIDLDFICRGLKECYLQHSSLEKLFILKEGESGIQHRINNFRNQFLTTSHSKRSEKHIASPIKGSAAKRINMFLRWMVRKDSNGVDFGLWESVSMAELCIPLDVHSGRVARELGLLHRKQNDWKAVEEVMYFLRKMEEKDPSKYDFALFGLGIFSSSD